MHVPEGVARTDHKTSNSSHEQNKEKSIETIEIDVPDLRKFCIDIVKSNSISIFKNVDLFYKCCRKNKSEFNHVIDANTETCLNDLTTKAMSSFFSTNVKEKSAVERAIERSKLDGEQPDDDRDIPRLNDETIEDKIEYKPEYKVIENLRESTPLEEGDEKINDLPPDPPDIDVDEEELRDSIQALPSFKNRIDDDDELLSQW